MKFTIELPDVAACGVEPCAYHLEGKCHAKAITVGDGINPGCDTFTRSQRHAPPDAPVAGVGACKVAICKYNRELECEAHSIRVDSLDHPEDATCVTFEMA